MPILILEDEAVIARLFARQLQRAGFEPRVALSAAEAETVLAAGGIAAALIDLDLYGSQKESLALLHRWAESVPCAVVSNFSDPGRIEAAKQAGAREFLVKVNINIEQLPRYVERLVSGVAGT